MSAFVPVIFQTRSRRERLPSRRIVRSAGYEESFGEVALPLLSVSSVFLAAASFTLREYYLDHRKDAVQRACVEVRKAGEKGLGVFATKEIGSGEYIGNYLGELLSLVEVRRRYVDWDGSYIYDLGNGKYIDATDPKEGNFTRYMNHTTDSKATVRSEVLSWRNRVEFYAKKHIHEGDELCFDYGDSYWEGNEHLIIDE
mmetsp:Transcript_3586/g.10791  ORF Transcript_3586/g.10791 Transcript_3586/m.10791 type:complete len:199 (+) Transcript_3586:31-627(+)